MEFVIDKDGSIVQESVRCIDENEFPKKTQRYTILTDEECQQEAIRLIKEAPAWIPGKQKGQPVKQKIVLPIMFK